jgi:hypothetical protein
MKGKSMRNVLLAAALLFAAATQAAANGSWDFEIADKGCRSISFVEKVGPDLNAALKTMARRLSPGGVYCSPKWTPSCDVVTQEVAVKDEQDVRFYMLVVMDPQKGTGMYGSKAVITSDGRLFRIAGGCRQ